MKLNGYKLRNAIQKYVHRREVLAQQFSNSLKVFPGEVKPHPTETMSQYVDCEKTIARLQEAQTRYNASVVVNFMGEPTPLIYLVKMVGGLGRIEKMWRTATGKRDRYAYDDDRRSKDEVYSQAVMTPTEILERSQVAASWCAAARESIAVGNATEIEIDVDSGLF